MAKHFSIKCKSRNSENDKNRNRSHSEHTVNQFYKWHSMKYQLSLFSLIRGIFCSWHFIWFFRVWSCRISFVLFFLCVQISGDWAISMISYSVDEFFCRIDFAGKVHLSDRMWSIDVVILRSTFNQIWICGLRDCFY